MGKNSKKVKKEKEIDFTWVGTRNLELALNVFLIPLKVVIG